MAWLLMCVLAMTLSVPSPAQACKIKPTPDPIRTDVGVPENPVAPPAPICTNVELSRSLSDSPGTGDCADIGSLALSFQLPEGSWPEGWGIRLRVVAGELPPFMSLPDIPWALTDSKLTFVGGDLPSHPINVTFQATAIYPYGLESAPTTIHVTHPGKSEGGCAIARHHTAGSYAPLVCVGLLLAARALARSSCKKR